MATPTSKQIKSGAAILAAPMTPGGVAIIARFGDVVVHPSGAGWRVCIAFAGATVPVGGLQAGASDQNFKWSTGPSFSGQGVPCTAAASETYDQTTTGYGSDGRISGSGATGTPSW